MTTRGPRVKKILLTLFGFFAAQSAFAQQSSLNFSTKETLHLVQPNYDLAVGGGVLLPTTDKNYFLNYYSNMPAYHLDASLSRLFWNKNLGFSIGLLGRYSGLNGPSLSSSPTDSTEQTQHKFLAVTGEGIFGLRYRNPYWTYLQPGAFVGIGASFFQESIDTESNTKSQIVYNRQWSPVVEIGSHLDISYTALTTTPNDIEGDLPQTVQDVLFRFSGSYLINPVQLTPSLSGWSAQASLVFLIQ